MTDDPTPIAERLAKGLPDEPGWVDIRGMLLSGRAAVTGGETVGHGFVVCAASGALSVVGVVGRPPRAAIAAAVADATDMTPVIARHDNAAHVGEALVGLPASGAGHRWAPERAIMHRLDPSSAPPPPDDPAVRLLAATDGLDHLPAGLRFEMSHAREAGPVAVTVADGRPVSFCYPCWTTETLWDVSIDTLEPYRGRGLAAQAVRFMIAHMRRGGHAPVWGALESNHASLALARRLGFVPADEIVVFSRGPWAYITRGFEAAPNPVGRSS